MLRAGLIKQLASGIYNFLPLGFRAYKKIELIVREEMDAAGAQELLMPLIHPAEVWQETGRWEAYGDDMFRLRDRSGRLFALGPTHEEIITDLVRGFVSSYKELPLLLYQIGPKFRDEPRPRFGIVRGREFIMKDAYSFHADWDSLDETYRRVYRAYEKMFSRMGLPFVGVEAATGLIGGSESHEFLVPSPSGEDRFVKCTSCGYAANVELASGRDNLKVPQEEQLPLEKVHTPHVRTVEEVTSFLGVPSWKLVKTLIYLTSDGEPVAFLIRGDHELNETKASMALGKPIEMAPPEVVKKVTGAPVGFAGPLGLRIKKIADEALKGIFNQVSGANEEDYHYKNLNYGRDYEVDQWSDIREVREGDLCPRCGAPLEMHRGMEIGHVFKLGTKYSEAMKATFMDKDGKEKPFIMGCYGIGVSRLVAAVIDVSHDDKGIIWPLSIAPYQIHIIRLGKSEKVVEASEKIYTKLCCKYEVLYDDRDESPGVKFNDADLLGMPLQVIVGKAFEKEGMVEIKIRRTGERQKVPYTELLDRIDRLFEELSTKPEEGDKPVFFGGQKC